MQCWVKIPVSEFSWRSLSLDHCVSGLGHDVGTVILSVSVGDRGVWLTVPLNLHM